MRTRRTASAALQQVRQGNDNGIHEPRLGRRRRNLGGWPIRPRRRLARTNTLTILLRGTYRD